VRKRERERERVPGSGSVGEADDVRVEHQRCPAFVVCVSCFKQETRTPKSGKSVFGAWTANRQVLTGGWFRILGFGCWVSGLGFRVSGVGFSVSCYGLRVSSFLFRVSGCGLPIADFAWSACTTEDPSWGYPVPVFGAVCPFWTTFAEKCPSFPQNLSRIDF